jgi:hypothetical protein
MTIFLRPRSRCDANPVKPNPIADCNCWLAVMLAEDPSNHEHRADRSGC